MERKGRVPVGELQLPARSWANNTQWTRDEKSIGKPIQKESKEKNSDVFGQCYILQG